MHVNDEASERLNLTEAAKILGVSVATARRLVFKNELQAFKVQRGDKERWEVLKSEVFRLKREGFSMNASEDTKPDFIREADDVKPSENASQTIPVEAHLEALKLLGRLQDKVEEERRLREQAERARLAMDWQMNQYRNALSEQAESLAEAQAMRKVAEAQVEERESSELALLAEENARLMQEFEAEKAALTERLKMSENRVDWLEKRVPRWVRSLFRAG
jgi:hypothetical protein